MQGQKLKTFMSFRNIPCVDHVAEMRWAVLGSRAAALKGRACQRFAFGHRSGEETGSLPALEPPASLLSFHCRCWCCPVGASGKPRASQSLEPFKKLSECWHMPFNRGLERVLITPVIEQAGKHISANISQGHFSGKKMRMHSWKSSLHSISPVVIIKMWRILEINGKPRVSIPHPHQLHFYDTYIIASLHLFLLLGSSVTEMGWGINIQMHVQFREENDLDMTLAKSTICAGNKMIFWFFI